VVEGYHDASCGWFGFGVELAYHRSMSKLICARRGVALGVVLMMAGFVAIAGCKSTAPPTAGPTITKTFPIRGKVVSVDAKAGEIVLDHQAVPGFMEAMVMPYKLADSSIIGELHPGDTITADVLVDQISVDPAGGFKNARLDHIVVVAQAKPDYKPAVQFHVPTAGDQVPDFALLNENGRTIHLDQFKGKVVLMTFIYTRCPLADFCPRMSRNFAEIDKALQGDPALYAKTHLISVSFDPAYDTPAVLKSYGGAYTGEYTKEKFLHWDFAAPPVKELPEMTEFFDVGVTPGEGKTLTHSLSTVVIGKDGKVVAWYPTNDWVPSEVVAAVKAAAA
jgi:protein SCO1/2